MPTPLSSFQCFSTTKIPAMARSKSEMRRVHNAHLKARLADRGLRFFIPPAFDGQAGPGRNSRNLPRANSLALHCPRLLLFEAPSVVFTP